MTKTEKHLRTAMVVDDEPALLGLLDDILSDDGFVTTCFARGGAAIEALTQRPFDLLVIDVNLPDMNGMHICEVARARYGEHVAIFIITADARKERCITALELGADDFIGKPFNVTELLARIEAKLRRANGIRV